MSWLLKLEICILRIHGIDLNIWKVVLRSLLTKATNDKVPTFKILSEQPLNVLCERLKPVLYLGETYIVREDDPLTSWVIDPESSSAELPKSTRTIKTHTGVEAFALMADDLKVVFNQCKPRIPKHLLHSFRYYSLRWRSWAAFVIQVNLRFYCLKKFEEHRLEDEKRVKNAPGAMPYAANKLRRHNLKARMLTRVPDILPHEE
ncbi:hypothetical protein EZV62_006068 [Acer yangbiense]|uniref:Uncharacterized protein n=1 Tax=Acer yangbiense TaxID=1000413 RepID=A0A5C7IP50_9ROSI|nr:hypothetical protein EZV62_006068 [Acer yangbiense]